MVKNLYDIRFLRRGNWKKRYNRIINMATEYLTKKLTPNDCIEMLLFANRIQMERFAKLCAEYIDTNFLFVFSSDEFLELDAEQLGTLLSLMVFQKMNKDDAKSGIKFWAKYKRAQRKKYVSDLLK